MQLYLVIATEAKVLWWRTEVFGLAAVKKGRSEAHPIDPQLQALLKLYEEVG
jgi:hypothetical protein